MRRKKLKPLPRPPEGHMYCPFSRSGNKYIIPIHQFERFEKHQMMLHDIKCPTAELRRKAWGDDYDLAAQVKARRKL